MTKSVSSEEVERFCAESRITDILRRSNELNAKNKLTLEEKEEKEKLYQEYVKLGKLFD
ncbi:MAG TPA: hypothetical protein PKK00_00180 [Bacteroidales bacterium]|nr:hypothetical protein [Bacteroidales bacterium]HPS16266.1 hypothetical protein [Bacteroidales bacterium]